MPRGRTGPEWLRSPPWCRALLASTATVLVSSGPPPGLALGPGCAGALRARRGETRMSPPARSDAASPHMPDAVRLRPRERFERCGGRRAGPLRMRIARVSLIALCASGPRHREETDGAARMESASPAQPIAQPRRRAARLGGGGGRHLEGWWPHLT